VFEFGTEKITKKYKILDQPYENDPSLKRAKEEIRGNKRCPRGSKFVETRDVQEDPLRRLSLN
jgi:hypothetical protein